MRHIVTIFIFILFSAQAYAMGINSDNNSSENPDTYQLIITGEFGVNIEGAVSYYNQNGDPQWARFYGMTPLEYSIQSKEGILFYARVGRRAFSPNRFPRFATGIFTATLKKGGNVVSQRTFFMNERSVTLGYGRYPNKNLEFMMMPYW